MFHIYPTDGYVNNRRNNYAYGVVQTPSWTSLNGSKLGPNTTVGYTTTVFEPIDEFKGDLARGYFYMSTRYLGEDSGWGTSDATNKSTIEPWEVCILLSWHHQDTVSVKEVNRNNAIYAIQNNRNPFIDHPTWADSIFTCTLSPSFIKQEKKIEDLSFFILPNQTDKNIVNFIFSKEIQNPTIYIFDVVGNVVSKIECKGYSSGITVDTQEFSKGLYFISLETGSLTKQGKLIIE